MVRSTEVATSGVLCPKLIANSSTQPHYFDIVLVDIGDRREQPVDNKRCIVQKIGNKPVEVCPLRLPFIWTGENKVQGVWRCPVVVPSGYKVNRLIPTGGEPRIQFPIKASVEHFLWHHSGGICS